MVTKTIAVCLFTILASQAIGAAEVDSEDYLTKFGYLPVAAKRSGNPHLRAAAKTRAIKAFQQFAHLPVTGELDEKTKEKMMAPRCGMADVSNTRTRASFVSKWDQDVVTWKLIKSSPQLDAGAVRRAIRNAFAVWSKIIPLNFTEVAQNAESDMQFDFGRGDHGCGYKFDGQGGTLAHAFFPRHGGLHYDDDEQWTYDNAAQIKQGYTDLYSVTIHEIGHALGLPHLEQEEAIMYPFYRHPELDANGQIKPFILHQYDIQAIQSAYGPREGATPRPTTPAPTPEPTPPGPNTGAQCPRFNSAVTASDGATYFFNGNSGWRKADAERGSPNSATRFYLDKRFPNGPSYVSAGLGDQGRGKTYLFQGRRVWGYSFNASAPFGGRFTLDEGFPKDLNNDVPFTPDGAFQLNLGHLVLVQGDNFAFWEPTPNQSTFKGILSNYFGTFPSKVSFNVGKQVYFLVGNDYVIYDPDARRDVGKGQLKQLITC